MTEEKEIPSAKSISGEGYNQTYIILSDSSEDDSESKYSETKEVFFRCGNWCYKGKIQFAGLKISTSDLPSLIPTLQRQQGSLRFFCNSKSIPLTSEFLDPVLFLNEAIDFTGEEMISDHVENELNKMAGVFPWINDDSASTYFELSLGNLPDYMDKIGLIASKTYTRGLIIISIYYEGTIYFVIQSGEGDQALLDVRFPDVSRHGQGLLLACYNDHTVPYRKLTLWHASEANEVVITKLPTKIKTLSITTSTYQQTYCIMCSNSERQAVASVHHDVLFRFGSWCYAGRVQLTPSLGLADIPFVIPALRMQQSRLDYVFDTGNIPTNSPFANCLQHAHELGPLVDEQIANSEEALRSLIDRLAKMGLGESIARWLEGEPQNSFFEFKLAPNDDRDNSRLKNIELIASKTYHPSGIVTVMIVFQNTLYVSLQDATADIPLLDSKFPDVSGKGRGYQIHAFPEGTSQWPSLRKVSIWQTVGALEQEFRDRAAQLAQAKSVAAAERDEDSESPSSSSSHPSDSERPAVAEDKRAAPVSVTEAEDPSHSSTAKLQPTSPAASLNRPSGWSNSPSAAKVSSISLSRPHHLPKDEGLSRRMEEIRRAMLQEEEGQEQQNTPWDKKGKPQHSSKKK